MSNRIAVTTFDFLPLTGSNSSSGVPTSPRPCDHSTVTECVPASASTVTPSCVNDTVLVIASRYVTYKVVVDVYLVGLLCLFGFLGNFLSIAVLCRDREKQNTTNWLLQSLAIVDNFYLVFSFFIQPIKGVHDLTDWFPSLRRCFPYVESHLWALASIAQTMAVWLVMLITIDRYVAVCRPWQTKWRSLSRVKTTVFAMAALAFVYNVPRFLEREMSFERDCLGGGFLVRTRRTAFRENRNYFLVYKTVCYFIFRSIGPLSILVALNVRLVRALQKVRRRHRDLTKKTKQRENITVMLVAVVTVFIVCQIPDLGLRVAMTAKEFSPRVFGGVDIHAMRYANAASNALLTVNSAVNFLVYCLVGKKFRRIFLRMARCSGDRGSGADGKKSYATTAAVGEAAAAAEGERDCGGGGGGGLRLTTGRCQRRCSSRGFLSSMGEPSESQLAVTTNTTTTTRTAAAAAIGLSAVGVSSAQRLTVPLQTEGRRNVASGEEVV